MARRLHLCRIDEIPDGTARGFIVADGSERGLDLFVWRSGDEALAYRNECPHQGTPLEMLPDKFMTNDRKAFLCTTHSARFRVRDGSCYRGPCVGKSLTALPLVRDGAELSVEFGDA